MGKCTYLIAFVAILTFGGFFSPHEAHAQVLINQEWVQQYGLPDTIAWSASTTDLAGNLYTTGNTIQNGSHTDVLLTKYDPDGNVVWQQTYDYQGGNDYGVALVLHNDGDLTIAAAVYDSSEDFNICLIHYKDDGTLEWSNDYDYEGGYDIPTSLATDISDNIYCAGGTMGSVTDMDYYTLKCNGAGTLLWSNSYDFVSGRDVPVSISSTSEEIVITGASEDSSGNWDFYTIEYDSAGNVLDEYRLDKPGLGFDEPSSITRDNAGNFYLTGRASDDGIDYYIQILKLSPQLNLLWEKSYSHGTQDGATALGLDSQGNVYITGYSGDGINTNFLVAKYDSSGNLLWDFVEPSSIPGANAMATSMHVDAYDQIFITGTKGINNQSRLFVTCFSTSGEKLWEKQVEDGEFTNGDILTNGEDAYISAQRFQNGVYQYVAIKYKPFKRTIHWELNSEGLPKYAANELIVRFDADAVNKLAVDDLIGSKKTEYGPIDYYLNPSAAQTVKSKLDSLCGSSTENNCPFTLYKVFRQLKTHHQYTRSRLGDTIPIPTFWATFVLSIPLSLDPAEVADSLNSLFPLVVYAHPNVAAIPLASADDTLYSEQASLRPTATYSDAHINIEPAWDVEIGKPFVRVGVFDSGLEWRHEDFGYDGTDTSSSVVVGGWDFNYNISLKSNPFPDLEQHGTRVAGIIGARRNNDIGIAGVAGGDQDSAISSGVSLYGMATVGFFFWFDPIDYAADAIITSAIDDSTLDYGYGLHITNHSYRLYEELPSFKDTNITLLREATHFSSRAKVTLVASRGNNGEDHEEAYPATYNDDWVLCVGGTGRDGQYIRVNVNGEFSASTGLQVDVAAPATQDVVRTVGGTRGYPTFNGTSSAAPHVSGVAALLMSYHNAPFPDYNNLAPEDVEQILQMTATDTDSANGYPGVDSLTGYGRLNAGAAFDLIRKPYRKIFHYGTDRYFNSDFTVHPYSTGEIIQLVERYQNEDSTWFLPGQYVVDVYEIRAEVDHNLSANDSILASWPRASSTNILQLYDSTNRLKAYEKAVLDSVTHSSGFLHGYIYKVHDITGNVLGWWPFDTSNVRWDVELTYSLLQFGKNNPVGFQSESLSQKAFNVYPNPTSSTQVIRFPEVKKAKCDISLIDLNGKFLRNIYHGEVSKKEVNVTLDGLPPGMYFYQCKVEQQPVQYIKIIKAN